MNPGAIFISYAAQDEDAAERLAAALRDAGLDVWFDRDELRGGDAWDALIRQRIRECALFVPVISAHTDARSEGYFRLEWRLAAERSLQMSDDRSFLVPVTVDRTDQATARVPERFRERQWVSLPRGEASPDFVAHVRSLIAAARAADRASRVGHGPPASARPSGPARRSSRLLLAVTAAALLLLVATGAIYGLRHRAPAATPGATAPGAAAIQGIAVLPFENLTGRAEDQYLADGLQEEVLNALARLRGLRVISRTSVAEYRGHRGNVRDIGQRLGVRSVLEGSVRREGSRLRLTVQLVDAGDDRHLLAANYDRDVDHILGLQSTVAREVAEALAVTLSRYERGELDRVGTNSGDAYRRYLQAVAQFLQSTPSDPMGVVAPIQLLEEAIQLDPDYSDAHALLSQAYTWRFFHSHDPGDDQRARVAFERAFAIEPQLPDAMLARGLYEMYVAKDLERALADLQPVATLRPNSAAAQSALGYVLRRLGRMDEALQHFVRAWDLDPLNGAYDAAPLTTLLGLRRYPEAIEHVKLDRARFGDDSESYFIQARIEGFVQQSAGPLRAALQGHGGRLAPTERLAIEAEIARTERHYHDAGELWLRVPTERPATRPLRAGFLFWAAGETARAEPLFREALALAERGGDAGDLDQRAITMASAQSMLGRHAEALATIDAACAAMPETGDPVNGPMLSVMRSILLLRAGRRTEAYAEAERLLRVPFAASFDPFYDAEPLLLVVRDDPHYDALLRHPPRL